MLYAALSTISSHDKQLSNVIDSIMQLVSQLSQDSLDSAGLLSALDGLLSVHEIVRETSQVNTFGFPVFIQYRISIPLVETA